MTQPKLSRRHAGGTLDERPPGSGRYRVRVTRDGRRLSLGSGLSLEDAQWIASKFVELGHGDGTKSERPPGSGLYRVRASVGDKRIRLASGVSLEEADRVLREFAEARRLAVRLAKFVTREGTEVQSVHTVLSEPRSGPRHPDALKRPLRPLEMLRLTLHAELGEPFGKGR